MTLEFTTSYLEDAQATFHHYKRLAEAAIAQAKEPQLYLAIDNESNSIALIVKHMAGNMSSRWTDFLTSDGEKPWRDRDTEFTTPPPTREALLQLWHNGWKVLFAALDALTEADLTRTITIRGEAQSVMQAINRQLAHYPYHCGQIIFLAKHLCGARWQSLSVPRGQSQEYTRKVLSGEVSQR